MFIISYRQSHLGGGVVNRGHLPVSFSQAWDDNSISRTYTESVVVFCYIYFIGYSSVVRTRVGRKFRAQITDRDLLSNLQSCTNDIFILVMRTLALLMPHYKCLGNS